jgi:hypothetical protein
MDELVIEGHKILVTSGELTGDPEWVRAARERQLLATIDDRHPLERLFDRITAARIIHYRPNEKPSSRQDIPCLGCGSPYRPDDIEDGENLYLCGSCMLSLRGG